MNDKIISLFERKVQKDNDTLAKKYDIMFSEIHGHVDGLLECLIETGVLIYQEEKLSDFNVVRELLMALLKGAATSQHGDMDTYHKNMYKSLAMIYNYSYQNMESGDHHEQFEPDFSTD